MAADGAVHQNRQITYRVQRVVYRRDYLLKVSQVLRFLVQLRDSRVQGSVEQPILSKGAEMPGRVGSPSA